MGCKSSAKGERVGNKGNGTKGKGTGMGRGGAGGGSAADKLEKQLAAMATWMQQATKKQDTIIAEQNKATAKLFVLLGVKAAPVAAAAAATQCSAALQVLADLRASMHQFHEEADVHDRRKNLSGLAVQPRLDTGERKSAVLASGVDRQAHGLQIAILDVSVHEPDCERVQPMHASATRGQELPGALFAARHQRLAAAIQHEHGHFEEPFLARRQCLRGECSPLRAL